MNPTSTPSAHFARHDDLVYETTRWQHYLFASRRNASDALRDTVNGIGHAVFMKTIDDYPDDTTSDAAHTDCYDKAQAFGGETFARLYADPAKLDVSSPSWAVAAHNVLDELPEWQMLRESVEGDADFSAIATNEILKVLADKLPGVLDSLNDTDADTDTDSPQDAQDGQPAPNGPTSPGGTGAGQGGGNGLDDDTHRSLRAALRRAVSEATKKTDEVKEALAGIAPGMEQAPPVHEQKDTRRLTLAEFLLNNPDMRKVLRRAGRLCHIADAEAKTKTVDGFTEVIGVEQGSDITRTLPSELALLGDDDLEILFMKDFVEDSLLQYRLEGQEPLGRGPIVVLCDESASMGLGDRNLWAKAAVIGCVSQGAREGRQVAVVMFNSYITNAWVMDTDGVVRVWTTAPPVHLATNVKSRVDDLIMELCTRGVSGGTNFNAAFSWAIEFLNNQNDRSDFVFVTDGEAYVDDDLAQAIQGLRDERGLRVFGVTVDGGSVSPAVKVLCDEVVDIDETTADDIDQQLARAIPVRR